MCLSYQTAGDSKSPPLIFLHGLGADSNQTVSALATLRNVHLIAPDMPGHGGSQDFPASELNFDSFADLVIGLMDRLEIDSCNVGGLSMGSGITLNLALRYPDRVRKMILLRPSWLYREKPEHLRLVAWVGQWIEQSGIAEARSRLLEHPDFQQLDVENKPVANSIGGLFQRPVTPASTAVLYRMWQDAPFSAPEQLSGINHPALVLDTTRDELHPQSVAATIATLLPNAETGELPPRYHDTEGYGLALNALAAKFLAR